MPTVYADSSALFALFHPRDALHAAVEQWQRRHSADFLSNAVLRFELRHNLRLCRGDPDGETAWRALQVAERSAARLRLSDLDLERTFAQAESLSRRFSQHSRCGAMDVFHVAAALEQEAERFLTCDERQAAFARAAGLSVELVAGG